MIIFDNIIFSIQRVGGISVYWSELIKRVEEKSAIRHGYIEYDNANENIFRKELRLGNIYRNSRHKKIIRYLPVNIKKNYPFIFHSSYYRICKNKNAINVTTVHDFTYEYFYHGMRKFIHCYQKYKAIRKSDVIVCISENTKKDLLRLLPDVDPLKVRVIYNGVSEDYHPTTCDEDIHYPFTKRTYVLFVGSRAIYKNFELAVHAVAQAKYNLMIIGSPLSNKEESFLNNKLGDSRFKQLGYVSNHDLNSLYNNAFALLYPSMYEGFGLPVIEAQKAGCPVIAYQGSSIPEVIGDTPLLIGELSVVQILNAFNILEDENHRTNIIDKGLHNSSRFTWNNMYNQLIKVYEEAWHSKKDIS